MLVESFQAASEAFATFESYKYDLAQVLFENFGRHLAHYWYLQRIFVIYTSTFHI